MFESNGFVMFQNIIGQYYHCFISCLDAKRSLSMTFSAIILQIVVSKSGHFMFSNC